MGFGTVNTGYSLKGNVAGGTVIVGSDGKIPAGLIPSSFATTAQVSSAVNTHNSSGTAHADIRERLNAIEIASNATGAVVWFAGSIPPEGYLACNGAAVSRTSYAALFAVLGTTYGEGDGEATFALPDLRDRVAWGGTAVGTVMQPGLPNITGTFSPVFEDNDVITPTGAFYFSGTARDAFGTGSRAEKGIAMDASCSNSIYGASDTVQPPALVLLPCIKY